MSEQFPPGPPPGELEPTPLTARTPWEFVAPDQVESMAQAERVLFTYPRKKDILKILEVAKATDPDNSGELWMLDVGGGNGFTDKLLVDAAREQGINLHAVVVDPKEQLVQQANEYYQEKGENNLHFVAARDEEAKNIFHKNFDLVLNSYMPQDEDLGKNIRQIEAQARVYIYDVGGATGTAQAYEPGPGFKYFGDWGELAVLNALEGSVDLDRYMPQAVVEVQLADSLAEFKRETLKNALQQIDQSPTSPADLYPWEKAIPVDKTVPPGDQWNYFHVSQNPRYETF